MYTFSSIYTYRIKNQYIHNRFIICVISIEGLTWEECLQKCPTGVVPAVHNATKTVTISGPRDKVHDFVQALKDEEIFAKEVNSSGVAFHSDAMEACAPSYKTSLQKVCWTLR